MIEQLFETSNIASAKAMMEMAATRHRALSSNLANVHTPGYNRIDVSGTFLERLSSVIQTLDGKEINRVGLPMLEESDHKLWPKNSASGNNVHLEREMTLMAHNAMTYEANAQFFSGSIRRLESAIKGRSS